MRVVVPRSTAVLLGLTLIGSACGSSPAPFYTTISGRLPVIEGRTLDGGSFVPSDDRGRIVVLNFWNQDCPPCRREMPLLQRETASLASRGVATIGLVYVGQNWPDDPAAALAFGREVGVTYPLLVDQGSRWAAAAGIQGLPTTVVADRAGRLRFRVLGVLKAGELAQLVDLIDATPDPGSS